jgi:hypothetical protein
MARPTFINSPDMTAHKESNARQDGRSQLSGDGRGFPRGETAIEDRGVSPDREGSLLKHLHHQLRSYVIYLLQCHLQCRTILIGSFVQNPFESEGSMVQHGLR